MFMNPSKYEKCPYNEFQAGTIKPDLVFQLNLFETSDSHPRAIIEAQNFADLKSFSIKNFSFTSEQEDRNPQICFFQADSFIFREDDPLYGVLSLVRGQSEQLSPQDQKTASFMSQFIEEPTTVIEGESADSKESKMSCSVRPADSNSTMPLQEDSSSHQIVDSSKTTIPTPKVKGHKQSTKNVTKNMGKLLFRFIWKNRNLLRKQLNISNDIWEEFVGLIRQWKKENNITREYLLSKWHSEGPHARIFRTISKHFYRKRGLAAIFDSKIECKQMHVQRLRRFEEATANAEALDCLN